MKKAIIFITSILVVTLLAISNIGSLKVFAAETVTNELKDGKYKINFTALYPAGSDKTGEYPAILSYFNPSADLVIKDGKKEVFLEIIKSSSSIEYLEVKQNDNAVKLEKISSNTEKDSSIYKLEVNDLTAVLPAGIKVSVPSMNYTKLHEFGLSFKTATVTPVEGETKPETPTDPVSEIKDGKYTVDFKVLHATKDEESRMKEYFGNKTNLTVKDGKILAQITVKGAAIKSLQVEKDSIFTDAILVSSDVTKDTREFQFVVKNLVEATNAKVAVEVEMQGGTYKNTYDFRYLFDEKTLVASTTSPTPDKEEDTTTEPDKETTPDSDKETSTESDKEEATDSKSDATVDAKEEVDSTNKTDSEQSISNPKTSDETKMGSYLLMLAGSLFMIYRKFRKNAF